MMVDGFYDYKLQKVKNNQMLLVCLLGYNYDFNSWTAAEDADNV